jgi:hypothetical protein
MLEDYVEVPRATSLLNLRYIPTPTRRNLHSSDEEGFSSGNDNIDEQEDEEFQYMIAEFYKRPTRYELDIGEYERPR